MFGRDPFQGESPEDGEAMDAHQRAVFFVVVIAFTTVLLWWNRFAVAQ